MKFLNQFLFICLTITSNFTIAQNYEIIKANQTALFYDFALEDEKNNVFAVSIDSMQTNQNDTILFPYPNIYEVESNCFTPFGPSIFGYNIITKDNGYNYFINKNYDTIKIKNNAELYENWIAFEIADSITVTASISSIYESNFLEITDTVKEISFEVLDATGNVINNFLSNNTIELSKNYGLVNTFYFREFPNVNGKINLMGLSNPKIGYQNLTNYSIFGFDIGDEIHTETQKEYMGFNWLAGELLFVNSKTISKIIDINFIQGNIVYTIDEEKEVERNSFGETLYNPPIKFISNDTIELVVNFDPDFSSFPNLPDSFMHKINTKYDYNFKDDIFRITTRNDLDAMCESDSINPLCFNNINCDVIDTTPKNTFINGLGGPYYHYFEQDQYETLENYNKLVYYKKENQTVGTPLIFTAINESFAHINFDIYPNPIANFLNVNVTISSLPINFTLYDVNGKLLRYDILYDINNKLNFSNLKSGIYFYELKKDDFVLQNGKLMK